MSLVVYQGTQTDPINDIDGIDYNFPSSSSSSSSPFNSTLSSSCPFVGLSNQGATCYLNSLLQSLFMTPEFQSLIFKWRYNEKTDGEKDHCIPYQIQKMFGFLKLSKRKSISTTGLTKSFGWEGSEVSSTILYIYIFNYFLIYLFLHFSYYRYFNNKIYKNLHVYYLMHLKKHFVQI